MEDIELALRSALPIDNIDRVLFDINDGMMLVWVDIQERPDLATLAERHGDQEGHCICSLFAQNHNKRNMKIALRVEMQRPTKSVFHLVFKVERYIEQLSLFAKYGKIWITPGPPPAHLRNTQEMGIQEFIEKVIKYAGQGITIELEPKLVEDLRSLLDDWKRARS